MATVNFQKVSGVLTVTQTSGQPRSFFGLVGTYNANSAGTGFDIQIGSSPFSVSLADLRINGQAPASIANGLSLLNSIFGT